MEEDKQSGNEIIAMETKIREREKNRERVRAPPQGFEILVFNDNPFYAEEEREKDREKDRVGKRQEKEKEREREREREREQPEKK